MPKRMGLYVVLALIAIVYCTIMVFLAIGTVGAAIDWWYK